MLARIGRPERPVGSGEYPKNTRDEMAYCVGTPTDCSDYLLDWRSVLVALQEHVVMCFGYMTYACRECLVRSFVSVCCYQYLILRI